MVVSARRAVHVRANRSCRTRHPTCLGDGQVLLRFLAAGVCGSDLPAFRGVRGKLPGDDGASAAGDGRLPDPRDRRRSARQPSSRPSAGRPCRGLGVGVRRADGARGDRRQRAGAVRSRADPQHAIGLQPLACVLYAVEQLPDLDGRRVAVIGQGSIGLLFSYVGESIGRGTCHRRRPRRPRRASARSSASTPWCGPPATGGSVIWRRMTGPTS